MKFCELDQIYCSKICLGALFVLLVVFVGCQKSASKLPDLEKLNIVMIVVDTLGAEHIGSYNNKVKHTPNIDRLAKNGVRFSKAFGTAPWTKPTISSMFTSLMPARHGVQRSRDKLPSKHTTLAEMLKSKGFDTSAIISHVLIGKKYGYAQGFKEYLNVNQKGQVHATITSEVVTDKAVAWLDKRVKEKAQANFFLFLHYFDPHFFYQDHPQFDFTSEYKGALKAGMNIRKLRAMIPELTADDIRYLKELYSEEVAYTDQQIGRFLARLEQLNFSENTLVIFLSDHGEEFMRHGWIGHTRTLHDELIHLPLIFNLPKYLKPRVVDYPVSQIDLVPTLMSMLKEPVADPVWEGTSLVPFLLGQGDSKQKRNIYSEVDFVSTTKLKDAHKTALIAGDYKLIHDKPTNTWTLFNRVLDPEELKNLATEKKDVLAQMSKKILAYEQRAAQPDNVKAPEVEINEAEIEQLESLGYM
ncbi:sulfatase [Oligoflexia bacterium]|nr:sulfatase [Oligoflexia bacterium]